MSVNQRCIELGERFRDSLPDWFDDGWALFILLAGLFVVGIWW